MPLLSVIVTHKNAFSDTNVDISAANYGSMYINLLKRMYV